jgi:hypothetical protein
MPEDTGYLTIAAWPSNWGAAEQTIALVKAAGLHPADAERRVRGGVPMMLGKLPLVAARSAEAILQKYAVEAVVLSRAEIAGAAPLQRAKRFARKGPGRYSVELWRGRPLELAMERVWLVVRAKIRKVTLGEIRADSQVVGDDEGGYGIETGVTRERSLRIRELIELHTLDGDRVRIDSSKFSFDVLGPDRGVADGSSADRLALVLAGEAVNAVVDAGYEGMAGGALISRQDVPVSMLDRQRFPDDDPVFDFYSVWVAERYRRRLSAAGQCRGA